MIAGTKIHLIQPFDLGGFIDPIIIQPKPSPMTDYDNGHGDNRSF